MYYVIYDLNDNIIGYFDNIIELLLYTGVRKNNLVRGLKNNNYYNYQTNNTYYKIYQFCD